MSEMHLRQRGFTYSACGPFPKNKKRIEKFMQTRNTDFIYRNELDKDFFFFVNGSVAITRVLAENNYLIINIL